MNAAELLKSAYEVAREERLLRNKKKLEELGLLEQKKEVEEKDDVVEPKAKLGKKRVKTPVDPSTLRRSKRMQGLTPEGTKIEKEKTTKSKKKKEDANDDLDGEDVEEEEEEEGDDYELAETVTELVVLIVHQLLTLSRYLSLA